MRVRLYCGGYNYWWCNHSLFLPVRPIFIFTSATQNFYFPLRPRPVFIFSFWDQSVYLPLRPVFGLTSATNLYFYQCTRSFESFFWPVWPAVFVGDFQVRSAFMLPSLPVRLIILLTAAISLYSYQCDQAAGVKKTRRLHFCCFWLIQVYHTKYSRLSTKFNKMNLCLCVVQLTDRDGSSTENGDTGLPVPAFYIQGTTLVCKLGGGGRVGGGGRGTWTFWSFFPKWLVKGRPLRICICCSWVWSPGFPWISALCWEILLNVPSLPRDYPAHG